MQRPKRGNTAPLANPAGPYLGAISTAIALDGSLSSDPCGDPLGYARDFGDGTTGTEVLPSHGYSAAAVYSVCLAVNDGTAGSQPASTIAVVFDPEGDFVTGGVWVDSPAGAHTPDPSVSGRATFGLVSKYKKGATVPEGNTEFRLQAGGVNLHSTAYQWLVVTKDQATAQFMGSGMANGGVEPNGNAYKFMVWAGDGAPDTFRTRIWWEAGGVETDVYDNGAEQATGRGYRGSRQVDAGRA